MSDDDTWSVYLAMYRLFTFYRGDNMSEEGLKFDGGKTDYSLVPWDALEQVVRVLMVGAKKYGPFNWANVDNAEQRYFSAAVRHLSAHAQGELRDDETGLPHAAHAACCMLFLLSHMSTDE